MEKISYSERVRSEEVFYSVKEDGNMLRQEKEGRLTGLVTSCVGTAF